MVSAFVSLATEFVWQRHQSDPVLATIQGVHEFDDHLPDLSAAGFAFRDALIDRWLRRFDEIDQYVLGLVERLDRNFIVAELKGETALRPFQRWRRQPSLYSDVITRGAYYAVLREELPLPERLGHLAVRLGHAAEALTAARANLDPALVPASWVDVAVQSATGGAAFLRTLPAMAGDDETLRADLERSATAAAAALESYAAWCRTDLGPQAAGTTEIGREVYDVLLKDRDLTEYDADTLLAFGEDLYRETEAALVEAAKKVGDGTDDWRTIVDRLRTDHPAAGELLETYRTEIQAARSAVITAGLWTMPDHEFAETEATPSWARPTYPYAAYVGPAPFGSLDKHGRFWVTLPGEADDANTVEERLQGHPRAGIPIIACHEAYPGHHLQFACAAAHSSVVRKHLRSNALIEGWGLYVEELMSDLGYLGSPETRLLRLKDLLWRAARVKVDVGLNTGTLTVDQAVELLVEGPRLERANAIAEVRRYTLNPLQAPSYALGRAAIIKMRTRARDRGWGMKEFHDRLLNLGPIPPKLAEDELF